MLKAGLEDLAVVSAVGAGTVGVEEASTLTVAVVIVGAVHAKAAQSQVTVLRVTAIVLYEPEFVVQV